MTGQGPTASLTQVAIRPNETRLTAALEIDVPDGWLQSLRLVEDDSRLYDCVDGRCSAVERFADAPVEIQLSHNTDEVLTESLQVKDLANIANDDPLVLSINIDIAGTPLRFPDDKYHTQELLVVTFLPTGVGVNGDFIPSGLPTSLAAASTLESVSGLGDYSAVLENGAVTVSREPRARHLVYAIAAAPVLLIVVAARALLVARSANSFPATGFLELAAALLAIFPLRVVLVPDGIGGLTRLDYILATEVVVIVSVVAIGAVLSRGELAPLPHERGLESPQHVAQYSRGESRHAEIESYRPSEGRRTTAHNETWLVKVGILGLGVVFAAVLWGRSALRRRR